MASRIAKHPYTDCLNPADQIRAEEAIAAFLFDNEIGTCEEDCQEIAQDVLYMAIDKVSPDLINYNAELVIPVAR